MTSPSQGWQPKRQKWPWLDWLTEDERVIVDDALRASADAKHRLAQATAILNPIRNRAINRAKYSLTRLPHEKGR